MGIVKRTAQAEDDLIDIWLYIAQDNPDAADKVLDELEDESVLLSDQPRLGPSRPDIAPELRYFPVGSYLILYRIIEGGIELVRVVHGARRLTNIILDK